ncbi:MAG: STN domain-containing protein [Chthonomonas sp.]|nr:STN domain-containing protein [Chthonomonas sp.]
MKKLPLIVLLALGLGSAWANSEPVTNPNPADEAVKTEATGLVNLTSKGKDVRDVLTDLFTQGKKNFVLDRMPRSELYLVLNGLDFDETLEIICRNANLEYEVQNGIYFIKRTDPTKVAQPKVDPEQPKRFQGKLSDSVLQKKFTTRFARTDFRDVIKNIAKQTNIWIEVDEKLTGRLVDAYLIDTTLKQGLDMLTQALGLEYRFTDNQSIMIFKPNPNRITVLDN